MKCSFPTLQTATHALPRSGLSVGGAAARVVGRLHHNGAADEDGGQNQNFDGPLTEAERRDVISG